MVIPHFFSKSSLPTHLPYKLSVDINRLSKTSSQRSLAKKAFLYVVGNWGGPRYNMLFKFHRLFYRDISRIFKTKGYLHCTSMNYILRVLLVKSGLFSDSDISIRFTNTWFVCPHQYLEVKLDDGDVLYLDPWNYQFGISYGNVGSGFDSTRIRSSFKK